MKISAAVRKETGHIALGVLILSAVMIGVFALVKRLDYTVLLGALLGSVCAVLNFLFMGLAVQRTMDEPENAQGRLQRSYTFRMLFMVAVMVVGVAVPCFNLIAVVVPFLFPRLVILLMQLLGVYRPQKKGGEK